MNVEVKDERAMIVKYKNEGKRATMLVLASNDLSLLMCNGATPIDDFIIIIIMMMIAENSFKQQNILQSIN